ncbi:DUF456 domain-containing protein [Ruficoccus amylovorans]|uniref:DUF456 domain-containing protein n=1 Tax=Ruficoccus amylovorans TaxID=1804625 RepID=A0A842HFJ0_9BACT|nr:DUF456 domain-containing protein [Ruficoccus amylovorans]MBC2594061.1 DUF456 domain-containing protein [Ruficoccus amylovorans]
MEHEGIHWLPFLVTALIIFIGVVGSIIPILPGCVIIWSGIVIYKIWVPGDISWKVVIITGALAALAQVLDFIAGYWGAKKFGGTTRGAVGAVLGGIIGPFVFSPFIGLVVGPVLGAIIGELTARRTIKESGKAGVGTLVGGIASFIIKIGISFFMTALFYYAMFT